MGSPAKLIQTQLIQRKLILKVKKIPVYKYFGNPAKYHGKPLFHILSNLKNFGVGRIITRSSFEAEAEHVDKPSFYRILWVQPLMDSKTEAGQVVAEKIRHGVR